MPTSDAPLPTIVRRSLRRRRLIAPGASVIAACSGGPDSVAMTHVLVALAGELDLKVSVASVDHGLRPEAASEVDAVGRLAASLGVPFHPLRLEGLDERPGPSLQAAAREARYRALAELGQALSADVVAVGHTRDDQAETVLHRLLRGAGVRGLGAIEPRREDGVVRPLIDAPRAAVNAYVERHDLPFVEDPSNADPRFTRVRIRHDLLPRLEAEDPALKAHLADLADQARALAAYMDAEIARVVSALPEGEALPAQALCELPPPLAEGALFAWVEARTGHALKGAHRKEIAALLTTEGEVWLEGGRTVARSQGRILVRRDEKRRGRPVRPKGGR